MTFAFSTPASTVVKTSCGGLSGCTAAGSTLTFDVQSLFTNWYSADVTFGGAAHLRVPFTFDHSFTGAVSIQVRNSRGTSNFTLVSIP